MHFLMHPHDVRWVFNEVIAQLADVHQTVLVYPDINECAKGGDIGHNPGQPESRFEVLEFADAFRKRENFKLLSRVAPRLGVEQAVVSPAAISITATPAWCSCPDRTAHTGSRAPISMASGRRSRAASAVRANAAAPGPSGSSVC